MVATPNIAIFTSATTVATQNIAIFTPATTVATQNIAIFTFLHPLLTYVKRQLSITLGWRYRFFKRKRLHSVLGIVV